MVAMPPSKRRPPPSADPEPARDADDQASQPAGRPAPGAPEVLEAMGLDRDDPVRARVDGQLSRQALDEDGAVLVEERDEPDAALLRLAARERLRAHVLELPPQRLVAPLGRLQDLAAERS